MIRFEKYPEKEPAKIPFDLDSYSVMLIKEYDKCLNILLKTDPFKVKEFNEAVIDLNVASSSLSDRISMLYNNIIKEEK